MVALLAGCGADEEPAPPPSSSGTAGSSSSTATTDRSTSGEDAEGGAGDEQPVESEVRLTARGNRLTPPRLRVAPFIAVRLELRSRDGRRHRVRVAGQTLEAGGDDDDRARVTLDGLTPDRSYTVRGLDGLNDARIVASGEPGG